MWKGPNQDHSSHQTRFRRDRWTVFAAFCAAFILWLMPSAVLAQTTYQYTNSTAGAIPESANCATTLTRTFNVPTTYSIADVNIAVALTHKNRDHLRVSLTSPGGTTASMMANIGGSADDLSVLFDDEAAAAISTHTTNDNNNAVPPYQRTFRPAAALSAFDGQAAAGTWTLTICDSVGGTTGDFTRADLYISPRDADLSLTKNVSNSAPASGASITYTLSATNVASSALTATGVQVRDQLPAGVNFVSSTGTGSYNAGTGIWSVGTLAPGASASITLSVTVTASTGGVVTNSAEISTSSAFDGDSTPNNSSTTEDDYAAVSFTVAGTRTAGTPPTLICPVGSVLFDWGTRTWTSGSLNNSYAITGIGSTNFAINTDFPFVTGSPAINGTLTGGFAGEVGLFQNMNNTTASQAATTVITLPTAVPGLQFRVFDIDFGAASYADRLTITGSFNGSPVSPTLTNGITNYVAGNVAIGDASAANTTADGTVVVTFSSPVDTITVRYGNHTTAPADPGNQFMSINDITLCNPVANLSVTKISNVVSDGVSATNPKAIPAAILRYCILVSNAGSATATNIAVADAIPATVTYIAGTLLSGTSCASATITEDDNAIGADETDPFGVSVAGATLTGTAASLGPASSFAIAFNARVN